MISSKAVQIGAAVRRGAYERGEKRGDKGPERVKHSRGEMRGRPTIEGHGETGMFQDQKGCVD